MIVVVTLACLVTLLEAAQLPGVESPSVESNETTFDPRESWEVDSLTAHAAIRAGCWPNCTCDGGKIRCDSYDSLETVPIADLQFEVEEIFITGQPRLSQLNSTHLKQFPNLRTLSITNSSLRRIEEDTFASNKQLRYINLTSNKIEFFNRSVLDGFNEVQLILDDNPLTCNCSIALLLRKDGDRRTVSPERSNNWKCYRDPSILLTVSQYLSEDCSAIKPNVTMLEPHEEAIWVILYEVVGSPLPNLTWRRDGTVMIPDQNIRDVRYNSTNNYNVSGRLEFPGPANYLNNGDYTLIAENVYGSHNRTTHAIFINVPGNIGHFGRIDPPDPTKINNYDAGSDHPRPDNSTQIGHTRVATDANFYIMIVLLSFIAVVIVLGMTCCWRFCKHREVEERHRRLRHGKPARTCHLLAMFCIDRELSNPISRETIPLRPENVMENPNYDNYLRSSPAASIVRIPSSRIQFVRELGEGAFGLVYLGLYNNQDAGSNELKALPVAIKTLKESHGDMRDFEREAELLTGLDHDNIVKVYGISDDREPRMIIFEYMENGDLNNFLRSNGPDSELMTKTDILGNIKLQTSPAIALKSIDLVRIAVQISAGVDYLACQHFVHRDLATRNCLVGDRMVVKIGDFGMSRDIYSADYYKVGGQTMLPVRWMPPESILYRTFTVDSDIWSFGVVLWEIYSYGKQPWYELANQEVIQQVQLGSFLPCPRLCPVEIYQLMVRCWQRLPSDRIRINEMHAQLGRILKEYQMHEHQGVQISPDTIAQPPYLELVEN